MKIEIFYYITARAARPRQPKSFIISVAGASGGEKENVQNLSLVFQFINAY
jgi:hypothetical protein